jgi:deazaflavin-dependent oxidoreductase (nitroreductase family)
MTDPDPDQLFDDSHVKAYLETDGAVGHEWRGTTILLLTTTGRTSGEPRVAPLIYDRDGDRYVIVASKGGAPQHPGWYRNLVANPDAEIQVFGEHHPVRARAAAGEERARLWELMNRSWPDYESYQRKTEREIPVVVLEPR